MPGFQKFSDEKIPEPVDMPHVVIAQVGSSAPKASNTRKYAIIAVSIIIAALIILAAILIGVHMITKAEKKRITYTLNFDKHTKQDVASDPNTNIVQYTIQNAIQKSWVVNDFNRDIQVVKIQTATQANCYVSALNRTRARDPTQITGPETTEITKASALTYMTSGIPISDTSFLTQAARDICQGISTYWLYPKCSDASSLPAPTTASPVTETPMNMSGDNSPWFVYWSYPYNANATVTCVTGCCKTVCACSMDYYWYYSAGSLNCIWVASACPSNGITANPISQTCANGPTGLTCPNHSPATLPSC